jgi:hypothetical protein
MTAASVSLLLGVVGLIGAGIAFLIVLVVARQAADRTGRVERRPLVIALVLGVVAVASIALIVGAVAPR